jgi:hypothetical protein
MWSNEEGRALSPAAALPRYGSSASVSPKHMLDAAFSLAVGGTVDVHVGRDPERAVTACLMALRSALKELAVDMSDRFPTDTLEFAYSAVLEGLELDGSLEGLKIVKQPPRVVMRREVERDTEGRIVALVDMQV